MMAAMGVTNIAPPSPTSRGFWGMLTPQEQSTLRASANMSPLHSFGPIMRQGIPVRRVTIIRSGWAKAVTVAPNGREMLLRLYGPGEVVGADCVLAGDEMPELPEETVLPAMIPMHVMTVPSARFKAFMARASNASLALHRVHCQRLRQADRLRALRAQPTAFQQVCGLLNELCGDFYSPLRKGYLPQVPLRQQDLADWLGLSRKSVVRALADLRKAGVIDAEPVYGFRITKPVRLIELAHAEGFEPGSPEAAVGL